MRKTNRFLIYLIIELLVIPVVILIFKFTPERQVAAVQAGALFVFVPLMILIRETLKFRSQQWLLLLGHLQFLLFFAVPIMSLRLLNWGVPFADLQVLGISGNFLHSISNYSFMLMMASSAWTAWSLRK